MASTGRLHRDEVLDPCSVGLLHIPGWREGYPPCPGAGGGLGSPVYLCWCEWNHSFLLWWLSRSVTDGGFLLLGHPFLGLLAREWASRIFAGAFIVCPSPVGPSLGPRVPRLSSAFLQSCCVFVHVSPRCSVVISGRSKEKYIYLIFSEAKSQIYI